MVTFELNEQGKTIVTVPIERDHLSSGDANTCSTCPVALAMLEAFSAFGRIRSVSVAPAGVHIAFESGRKIVLLPTDDVRDLIYAVDGGYADIESLAGDYEFVLIRADWHATALPSSIRAAIEWYEPTRREASRILQRAIGHLRDRMSSQSEAMDAHAVRLLIERRAMAGGLL